MPLRYNVLQGSRTLEYALRANSWPSGASEHCYSVFNGRFWRGRQPVQTVLYGSLGGRGPPGRLCRPELQALSNSLQLTSI